MSLFLFLLLIMLFFFFYKIEKNKKGQLKIKPRQFTDQEKWPLINQQQKAALLNLLRSKLLLNLLSIGFVITEIMILSTLISPIETLIKVRASQLIPQKFNPIARFAANMDWDNKTITLDASMSKAFEDQITNYIWRIDDGTSLTGSKEFTHTFKNPGYYYIQLSIVDADNQSDVATCRILIPPEELEQVATHERTVASPIETQQEVKDVDYDWSPKGTFFNYSKMLSSERSYANLKSHYIESGCGYSNRGYNTQHSSYVDFFHDNRVQLAMTKIMRTLVISLLFTPVVYWISKKYLKKLSK